MEWSKLLSTKRLSGKETQHRNEFDDDYKRIVTSPSFRRLQDKTQVFPLERLDFIHTRLTHSLEVAMVARSLAKEIVILLQENIKKNPDSLLNTSKQEMVDHQEDVLKIVECASLVHDIGNPPYGHFGEDIIRQWFKKNLPEILRERSNVSEAFLNSPYVNDFYRFEGNAQSLRIVSKLHDFRGEFDGLDLTAATLNTILKYTYNSSHPKTVNITTKKVGYFIAEGDVFKEVTAITGAGENRHPLTFILEAADDIAYLVADMEDAIGKGIISFRDVREFLLENLSTDETQAPHSVHTRQILTTIDEKVFSVNRFFVDLRDKLIDGARHSFVNHYEEIMEGSFNQDLFKDSWAEDLYKTLRRISQERIYDNKNILRLEIAGYTTLTYLLGSFVPSLVSYDTERRLDYVELKKIGIISESQKRSYHFFAEGKNEVEKLYLRLLLATDFISGMTDSYAHRLYSEMVGI